MMKHYGFKRILAALLCAVMALSVLPANLFSVYAADLTENTDPSGLWKVYGTPDTTTKGAWNTAGYGSYDAVLLGYNYTGTVTAGKRTVFKGASYTNTGAYIANDKVSVTLPNTNAEHYAFGVTEETETNPPSETLYNPNADVTAQFDAYYMGGINKTIPGADELPTLNIDTYTDASGVVQPGWDRVFFTFTGLEDDQYYLFRVYTNNNVSGYYKAKDFEDLKVHFVEDDGTVHAGVEAIQSNTFNGGVYRTYLVKGSFTVVFDRKLTYNGKLDRAAAAGYWGPSGFFFDEYEPMYVALWQQYGDIDTTTHGAWQTKGYGEKQAILLGWNKAAENNETIGAMSTAGGVHIYSRKGINPIGANWHKDTSANAISMVIDNKIHGYMGGDIHLYRAADKMGFATNKVHLETPEGYTGTVPVYNTYTTHGKAASEAPFTDVCPISEGNGGRLTLKFSVPDGNTYAFRIYADTRNYKYKVTDTVTFHFLSEDGTQHYSSTEVSCANFDKDGAYITFKVQGSFLLLMDKEIPEEAGLNSSTYFGMSAFFFDDVTEAESFPETEKGTNAHYALTDTATTGAAWQTAYGDIDAVLPGYSYTGAVSSIFSLPRETYDYIHKDSVRTRFEGDNWRAYAATGEDVLYNPNLDNAESGVTETFNVFTAGGASSNLYGGMFKCPDGYVRNIFHFNDLPEDAYQFTLYGNNDATYFAQVNVGTLILTFVDEDGDIMLQDIIDTSIFNDRAYRSYMLKGNFTLILDKDTNAQHFGFNGFFFSQAATNFISNFQAVAGSAARSVQLTWTETDADTGAVVVLERSENGGDWEKIAEVAAGTKSYLDTGRHSGSTYRYRAYIHNSTRCSFVTEPVSYTLPSYTPTVLTLDAQEYSCKDNETPLTVKATLTLKDGTPCAGLPVYLKLAYSVGTMTTPAALTDANGVATITFTPKYQGKAVLTACFDDDDTLQYSYAVSAQTPTLVGETRWAYAPEIYKITDALLPGSIGSINGYGFCNADMSLVQVRYAAHLGTPNVTPTSDARVMPLVQTDEAGLYISFKLPETATPGLYDVWVYNGYGWSEPIVLNAPRPLFMSEYEAWEGQTLQISGRCLQAAQFGAVLDTRVRLVNDSNTYNVELTKVTPYSLAFTVPTGAALGKYEVQISNDSGATWTNLESDQTLTVVEKGNDGNIDVDGDGDIDIALNSGLAWMNRFKWDNVFDVTDYGAVGTDTSLDTTAFNKAITAASNAGGGVVYIPNGTYYLRSIALPAHVVLLGESMNGTVLTYDNYQSSRMFYQKTNAQGTGHVGFARFTIDIEDPAIRPDSFFWLGHLDDGKNASTQTSNRTASCFFLSEINWDYGRESSGTGYRGMGLAVVAKERLLVQNCVSDCFNATVCYNKQNEYAIIRDNIFKYDTGNIYCNANYAFIENNEVYGRLDEVLNGTVEDSSITDSRNTHGICVQAGAHLEGNIVGYMGSKVTGDVGATYWNDGETYLCELSNDTPVYGDVIASTHNTITVKATGGELVAMGTTPIQFNYLAAIIHDGRGMGQYRKVTNIDPETGVVTVAEDWAVQPDYTSKVSLIVISDRTTFYNNEDLSSTKGVYIYGNMYDTVVANHKSTDTEGVLIFGSQVSGRNYRIWNNFYITVRDSVFEGVSPRSQHCNISVPAARAINGSNFYGIVNYAVEIRGNTIIGDPDANPVYVDENGNGIRRTESPQFDGIYVATNKNADNVSGDNTDVIVEDNLLKDVETGVLYSMGEKGLIIENNACDNVETPIYHHTANQTDKNAVPEKVLISDDTMNAERLHRYAETWEHYDTDTYCNSQALVDAVAAALAMDDTATHYEMNEAMAAIRNAVYGMELHVWDAGTVTQQPTVEEYGVKTYTCESCGHTKTAKVAKLAVDLWQQVGSTDKRTGGAWETKGYGEVQAVLLGWKESNAENNGASTTTVDRFSTPLYTNENNAITYSAADYLSGNYEVRTATRTDPNGRLIPNLDAPAKYTGVIPQYNTYARAGFQSTDTKYYSAVKTKPEKTNYRNFYKFTGLDADKEYIFTAYFDTDNGAASTGNLEFFFCDTGVTKVKSSAYVTAQQSDFVGGGYISFKVKGDFCFGIDKADRFFGPSAFFFDECALPEELVTDSWCYYGADTITKGAWNTAGYGSYDAVLLGYNYTGTVTAGKRTVFKGASYTNTGAYIANDKVSVTLPNTNAEHYAFGVTEETETNPPSETLYNPNADVTAQFDAYYLGGINKTIPGASSLPTLNIDTYTDASGVVQPGWDRVFFTFTGLEDDQEYLFRVYTNNNVSGYYKAKDFEDLKVHFVEDDGTVHAGVEAIQSNTFNGGAYRAYKVKGNFTVVFDRKLTYNGKLDRAAAAGYWGPSGFFFDEYATPKEKVEYTKISLDGTIGVSYGVNLNIAAKRDTRAAMILSQEGKEDDVAVTVSQAGWEDKLKWFTRGVAAKEMTDMISAQIYYSNGSTGSKYDYSVESYASNALQLEQPEKLKDLLKAMLNYGGMSQSYFGYNETQMANRSLTLEERWTPIRQVTADDLRPYFDKIDGGSSAAPLSEASLLLKSGTTLRLSFLDSVVEGKKFICNGEELTVYPRSGKYSFVDIENIPAAKLGDLYVVEIYEGEKLVSTVKYCPLAYAYAALTQSDDPDLHNTVKALYLYHKAVDAFFNG